MTYYNVKWESPGITYQADSRGIGEMLDSEMIRSAMVVFADEIKIRAEVMAPVFQGWYYARDVRAGRMRGRYKASFHVRSHLHGGATHDRAEAIVYNDSPEAFYVEFGHRGTEPEHILARAAFRPLKGVSRG